MHWKTSNTITRQQYIWSTFTFTFSWCKNDHCNYIPWYFTKSIAKLNDPWSVSVMIPNILFTKKYISWTLGLTPRNCTIIIGVIIFADTLLLQLSFWLMFEMMLTVLKNDMNTNSTLSLHHISTRPTNQHPHTWKKKNPSCKLRVLRFAQLSFSEFVQNSEWGRFFCMVGIWTFFCFSNCSNSKDFFMIHKLDRAACTYKAAL